MAIEQSINDSAPAPITDRPLAVVDLLDGAFAALRQRPRVIVTIVACLVIPVSLAEGYLARNSLGGASLGELLDDPALAEEVGAQSTGATEIISTYLLDWLMVAVAGVAVSRVVAGWLTGHDTAARDALTFTARRAGVILAAFVLVHLIELVGFVLLVFPGLAAVVLLSLTSPVIALEDLGPVASMRRSATLVRRRPAAVAGLVILTGLVSYGVSNAVSILPTALSLFLGPDRSWPLISLAAMLSSIILVPFTAAAMCLAYLDLRFRTEGLDLQLRIDEAFPTGAPGSGA